MFFTQGHSCLINKTEKNLGPAKQQVSHEKWFNLLDNSELQSTEVY